MGRLVDVSAGIEGQTAVNASDSARFLQIPVMGGRLGDGDKPSSRFRRFASTDLDAFRERLCGLFNPHDIIPRDRHSGTGAFGLDHVDLGSDLLMSTVTYNQRVRIQAPPLEQFFVFQFTLDGVCQNTLGDDHIEVLPGSMCVLNLGRPIRQDMSAGYRQMAIRISRSLLEQTLEEELGYRVREQLEFTTGAYPVQATTMTLAHMISGIWNDLQRENSGYAQSVVRDRVNRTFAALLLATTPHNYSDMFAQDGGGPVPFFVRKAELFMRENATENLTLTEIACAAGVSVRTLQNGFRNFRGTTPMTYLKSLRLNAARKQLSRSRQNERTVTEIALDCGFSHLSKFAQDYRQHFGESPSETARRGTV